jgi:zeaxanthin glucosyltransferase
MSRFGFICLPGRGHLYPALALANELQGRGHEVVFFGAISIKGAMAAIGVRFVEIASTRHQAMRERSSARTTLRPGIDSVIAVADHADSVLKSALSVISEEKCDALLIDQGDLASGSIADALRIPFITLCFFPPIYINDRNPPFTVGWTKYHAKTTRRHIAQANRNFVSSFQPTLQRVNAFRKDNRLKPFCDSNSLFSTRAIITQLPYCLELPGVVMPRHVYYAGPFVDPVARPKIPFPWDALTGQPIVFASFGTVRNELITPFVLIADALSGMNVQLVMSLGGTYLAPSDMPVLADNTIVVHYAPQLDLLKLSSITICHGGLNTCLESLLAGVPVLALPMADDQPGVADRLRVHRLGVVVPYRRARASTIRSVLNDFATLDRCRNAAANFREAQKVSGCVIASEIIESVIQLG